MIDETVLGKPRRRPDGRCSKCDGPIGEDDVPLILWADGRNLMWIYCDACQERIWSIVRPRPAVTVDAKVLHYADGRPVTAGDIAPGETIKFDRKTGVVEEPR